MITKPSKEIEVFKLILIYAYGATKCHHEIIMNQQSFAEYLDISTRSVIRHFNKAKELGLIEVTSKQHIYNKKKRSTWTANIYDVDIHELNDYIFTKSNYDVLEHIDVEIPTYYKYMTFVKEVSRQKKLDAMTDEERIEYEENESKKQLRRDRKLQRLQEENKYFLNLLDEVNNPIFPLYYLNDGKKRLVNIICNTRNPENEDTSDRIRVLSKYFGTDDLVEFDTNASIYRLSYILGNKECPDPNIDFYKLIFDKCNFDIPWTIELRKKFKYLLMPIYMREYSIKYNCLIYNFRKDREFFSNKQEGETYAFYKKLEDDLSMSLFEIFSVIRDTMHEIFHLNKFYKADIFIYESNLHILMLKIFKDMGIKTIDVYDGFYFIRGTMTQELYNKVYKQAAEQLLDLLFAKA